ncbi:hypothetical protein [Natranaeroarchaeum sulfidigenes]|uniref:hypothetical protein n=1 Tax=Natranaeroarchaeum sulfidigenes TaxID=2784880 RepID=UPI001EE52515|nr:hypothetical protein [Natranaeroarchaeum sulfidigenes]
MSRDTDVFVTEGLVDALLEYAAQEDPESLSMALSVTPAGDLDGAEDLDPDTPVFTDLYVPQQDRSVNVVFGMDFTIPPRQTQGRFLSHPDGTHDVTREDDLHEVMLVAVPPWKRSDLRAYNRSGRRLSLTILNAIPPEDGFEDGYSR